MSDFERELDWDDYIEKESDFTILPEGDYSFTVSNFERARHAGSAKLPPCNKAVVQIYINTPQGSTTINHNLFLHTKTEGMLSAFFKSIGQKQTGEKLQMNWNTVVGSTGICKVGIRQWESSSGEKRESNEIKKFYSAEDAPAPAPKQEGKTFTAGTF